MTIRLPNATRSAGADAMADLVDGGTGPGYIEIRTGTQPADPDSAASGTLLATIPLNDPAYGAAADGVKTLDADPELTGTGVAAGTAGWFRVYDSDDASVFDGSASASGGGGDLTLATTAISVGLTVRVTSGSFTVPAG